MRKALLTIAEGDLHEEMLAITGPGYADYAARHGYDVLRADLVPGLAKKTWSKVFRLCEALERYDVVLWMDCDAAIRPGAPDMSQYLADTHAFQALTFLNYRVAGLNSDNLVDRGLVPTLLATGVWLVQQHPFTVRFFADLCAQRDLLEHPAAEAAAVWRLLGVEAGHEHQERLVTNNWLTYPLGTVLLNDRWNSRDVDNAPYIFHAAWLGAKAQPELRLRLLREFVDQGTIPPDLLEQRLPPAGWDGSTAVGPAAARQTVPEL